VKRALGATLALALLAAASSGAGAQGSGVASTSGRPIPPIHAGAEPPHQSAPTPSALCPGPCRDWTSPLDRRVTMRASGLTLRSALDRLATAARLRLSYSAELLPLEQTVRGEFENAAAGDVLVSLLEGSPVEPIALGDDQVVLAAVRRTGGVDQAPRPQVPQTLDRVVVTERAEATAAAAGAVRIDVVRPRDVVGNSSGALSRSLDGTVPGLWMWEQSPASVLARYGSIRGASSFGVTAPKIYIDGIQVANPLLITRIAPENVERIEVIRGPQGAALYGADALDGVINVVMRHDGVEDGSPRAELRSEMGTTTSDFTAGGSGVLTQEHLLALRAGSALRSADAAFSFGSVGDVYPGARSWHLGTTGGFRAIGERSTVTGTLRISGEQVGTSPSPVLSRVLRSGDAGPAYGGGSDALGGTASLTTTQALWQYTLGTTARLATSDRVTNTIVVGIDGYRLGGAAPALTTLPLLSPADSALLAARGSADRITLRMGSVGHFGDVRATSLALRASLEETLLRQSTVASATSDGAPSFADWFGSTGLSVGADLARGNAFVVSGGARLERSDGTGIAPLVAVQPMLGAAVVRHPLGSTLTLRAAYGKATRASRIAAPGALGAMVARLERIAPEEQTGFEAGADLSLGRALTLRVTRFDQRASRLVQRASLIEAGALPDDPDDITTGVDGARFENAGAIANRGWELQGSSRRGPLSMMGTVSLVDSRILAVGDGAAGELQPGDRVLGVPAATTSLSAQWERKRWSAGLAATRAFDWVNYDRLALARALATSMSLDGTDLRDHRRHYDGLTHLRATASRTLRPGFTATFTVDNLLDRQTGEPDDVSILPGRTISAALRVAF
jgi:outer membrane receptor protein involved in Fe transport